MSAMKSRRWGVYVFRQFHGAPMVSLGLHLDFHTPRLDVHLPLFMVSIGRIVWEPGTRRAFYLDAGRWSGHTDDCWHREEPDELLHNIDQAIWAVNIGTVILIVIIVGWVAVGLLALYRVWASA